MQSGWKGYKIVFNTAYEWVEVEGDDDRGYYVPASIIALLPDNIQKHLAATPNVQVVDIEKTATAYILDLSDDREVYFDLNGNYLRTDD